jgi:HEAT repeat protein
MIDDVGGDRVTSRLSLLALFATLVLSAGSAGAEDDPVCTCREGNACWRYLRAPVAPPDDPCVCEHCRRAGKHTGEEPWPDDWVQLTFKGKENQLAAFLRRHAASWGLTCSLCDQTRLPGLEAPERYPFSPKSERNWNPRALEMIRKQLAIEKDLLPYSPVVIESPHFYLVLDIPELKIQVQGRNRNTTRTAEMHELGHVYIERLEKGYMEFCRVFGPPRMKRPIGVYMPESSAVARVIQETYLGHPDTTILLGGGSSTISGGHCMCGFTAGLHRQKLPSKPRNEGFAVKWRGGRKAAPPGHFVRLMDDDQVHLRVRHLLGHTLLAMWPTVNVKPVSLRPWLYVGVGHWLARRHPRLGELATYCGEECKPLRDSGKKWIEKARRMAGNPAREPAEEMCAAHTLPEVNRFESHLRAWSWFVRFIEHDAERFVAFVRALRAETPASQACQAVYGCSLDELDRRWADLARGRRPDEEDEDDPAEIERAAKKAVAAIGKAKEPARKAALLRNLPLDAIRGHMAELLPLLGHPSAHVRETTVILLIRSDDQAVPRLLRSLGPKAGSAHVVANVARIFGLRKDAEAVPILMRWVDHRHWLVRANVARALALIRPEGAGPVLLARLAKETAPRTKIALFDALSDLRQADALPLMTTDLGASEWQVRVAAAHALGRLGLMAAVPDLITRMECDGGRVREESRDALKRITRDDLGANPEHWREWWKRRKAKAAPPPTPEPDEPEKPAGPEEAHPTGTIDPEDPTYYGIRIVSERVGYVLDISQSMSTVFRPTESLQKKLRRAAAARPRLEFARDELIDSVKGLDPRSSFNIWTFHDVIQTWKPAPVFASASNRARAVHFLRNVSVGAATNYYDALRAVLGLPEMGLPTPGFRPTPDTVFFLTDGEPTVGDITDAEELLAWFVEENRYARIRCHVIAFGDKNLNFELLAGMARESGGTLLHLRER